MSEDYRIKILKKIAAIPTPSDLPAGGQCYSENGRTLLYSRQYNAWKMIHGRPTLRTKPYIEYGHAWLESPDGEAVYDASMGREFPKELYYAIGKINPEDSFSYTIDEARRKSLEYKHWGPWEGVDAGPPIVELNEDEEDEEIEW